MTSDARSPVWTTASEPPVLDRPRLTGRGVLLAAVFWGIYTLIYSVIVSQGVQIPFVWAFEGQIILNGFMAAYSVPVWLLIFRVLHQRRWMWQGAAHLLIAPFYAWLAYISFVGVVLQLFGVEATLTIRKDGVWIIFGNFTTYVLQFVIYHTIRAAQRYRLRQQQAAELQALARQQELTVLKAQINPHFLFNTLNSISAMVVRDPHETREMISHLSDLLRYALDSSQRDLVPLREEVDFVKAYLDLEAHRYADRLQVYYEVNDDTLDTLVPPMILQPLVENAIKHGIAPSEAGGSIRLYIGRVEEALSIRVEDTGIGINGQVTSTATSNGIGLANTSARLERTFGPGSVLHTETIEPHGFRVHFRVPVGFEGRGKREEGRERKRIRVEKPEI